MGSVASAQLNITRDEIFQGKLGLRGIEVEARLAAAKLCWGHLCTCKGKTVFLAKWVPWKTLRALLAPPAPWLGFAAS